MLKDVMLKEVKSFIRDENGAALIEYGIVAALIAVVAVAAIRGVGTRVNTTFANVNAGLSANMTSTN